MTKARTRNVGPRSRGMTRRDFVRLTLAGLLAGCRSVRRPTTVPTSATPTEPLVRASTTVPVSATSTAAPTAVPATLTTAPTATPTAVPATTTTAPTVTPTATATSPPTATPTPTATATSTATATPTTPPLAELSTVVQVHHAGVWDDDTLVPGAIRQMVDASITQLTGENDVKDAWTSLFSPNESIAIKVNTIRGSLFWTHAPLVMAVTDSLQEAGVPAEQILIFDRSTSELEAAGYSVNMDGPGVRCYGTVDYTPGWKIMDADVKLSDILMGCDALINIPLLKQHGISGISFAMKNHYGTFDRPGQFHRPRIDRAIAELNALRPIKSRTRLIIGDVLKVVKSGWHSAAAGDSILMSFDPVAHDMVGLQVYAKTLYPGRDYTETAAYKAIGWLENGAKLGLGTHDLENIDWREVNLG